MKIYKGKIPNLKKISLLFVAQVAFGLIPAIVGIFCIFHFMFLGGTVDTLPFIRDESVITREVTEITEKDAETHNDTVKRLSISVFFVGVIMFALAGYIVCTRRYNILVSGLRGERFLKKLAKASIKDGVVFTNLPVRYKKNRSEIDMLIVNSRGFVIVEVKNHSGEIEGCAKSEKWTQTKRYKDGRCVSYDMQNPFFQAKKQREILKNILRAEGYDVWIDEAVFFSNEYARLKISGVTGEKYFVSGGELIRFVMSNRNGRMDDAEFAPVVEILKTLYE